MEYLYFMKTCLIFISIISSHTSESSELPVITSNPLLIGWENSILVPAILKNVSLIISSGGHRHGDCTVLYESSSLEAVTPTSGEYSVVKFYLPPPQRPLNNLQAELAVMSNGQVLFLSRDQRLQYPQISIIHVQREEPENDSISAWIFTSRNDTRPAPDVELRLFLTSPQGTVMASTVLTTDSTGLAQHRFHVGGLGRLQGDWTITAAHNHYRSAEVNSTVKIVSQGAHREFVINMSSKGYKRSHNMMMVQVDIRRPGLDIFDGQVDIKYWIRGLEHHTKRIQMEVNRTFRFHPEIGRNLQKSDKLVVQLTAIEHGTGVMQIHLRHLDIFPDKFEIYVHEYNHPSPNKNVLVTMTSKSSHQLFRRAITSNDRGEIFVRHRTAENLELIYLEVCDDFTQIACHFKVLKPSQRQSLIRPNMKRYIYTVGENIELLVNISRSSNMIISSCDGKLRTLPVTSSRMTVQVTSDMYPVVTMLLMDTSSGSSTPRLHSLSFHVVKSVTSSADRLLSNSYYKPGEVARFNLPPTSTQLSYTYLLVGSNLSFKPDSYQTQIPKATCQSGHIHVMQALSENSRILPACSGEYAAVRVKKSAYSRYHRTIPTSYRQTAESQPQGKYGRRETTPQRLYSMLFDHTSSFDDIRLQTSSSWSFESLLESSSTESPISNAGLRSSYDAVRGRNTLDSDCFLPMPANSHQVVTRCFKPSSAYFRLPPFLVSDWMVTLISISPFYGLQSMPAVEIKTKQDAYLSIKAPPSDLSEGEQFQLPVNVFSSYNSLVDCHVRLIPSNEEAFCFNNLTLNKYPHINLRLGGNVVEAASFVATALKRGTYSIHMELLIGNVRIDRKSAQVKVVPIELGGGNFIPMYEPPPGHLATSLQVKMSYEKANNQQRCKGFRLKVDHSEVVEPEDYGINFDQLLGLRSKRAIQRHRITNLSSHSLRVCYRILKKSTSDTYYIDVESFTGYKAVNHTVEAESASCSVNNISVINYGRGQVIMVENSITSDSWCCLTVLLRPTSVSSNANNQSNQSAAIRMHDSAEPTDFCLEFYNLKSSSPYSNHICSQHGCLCTEGSMNSCSQNQTSSLKATSLSIAQSYLSAQYAFKVNITDTHAVNEYRVANAVIAGSYGKTLLNSGQSLHIYYRPELFSCSLFNSSGSLIIMGRQSHLRHGAEVASIYLDQFTSILDENSLYGGGPDGAQMRCYLDQLLCPAQLPKELPQRRDKWTRREIKVLSRTINSMCRRQAILSRASIPVPDISADNSLCHSGYSNIFTQKRLLNSVYNTYRKNRKRKRQKSGRHRKRTRRRYRRRRRHH